MIERGVNSPLTSSMGRLFDTVAALVGVADDARYEGEAAILLEAVRGPCGAQGSYAFELDADATGLRWHHRSGTGTCRQYSTTLPLAYPLG